MGRIILAVLAVGLFGASPLYAQALKDQLRQEAASQEWRQELAYTNKVCKTGIQGAVEWQSFSQSTELSEADAVRGCDVALSAVEHICQRNEDDRKALVSNVTFVRCKGGALRGISLRSGTLVYTLAEPDPSAFGFIEEFLSKNLGLK